VRRTVVAVTAGTEPAGASILRQPAPPARRQRHHAVRPRPQRHRPLSAGRARRRHRRRGVPLRRRAWPGSRPCSPTSTTSGYRTTPPSRTRSRYPGGRSAVVELPAGQPGGASRRGWCRRCRRPAVPRLRRTTSR
jgi:hypothetical protein